MKSHLEHKFLSVRPNKRPYVYDLGWPFTTHARKHAVVRDF